ncbi:hypothetical protein D3C71_1799840 [compost metagenome]
MPVYYLLGGNDWQAPNKGLYMIPDAGHMTMMDQPDLFYKALHEVYEKEHQ